MLPRSRRKIGALLYLATTSLILRAAVFVRVTEATFQKPDYSQDESIESKIELSRLAYAGNCEASAEARWNLIRDPSNRSSLILWEKTLENYIEIQKSAKLRLGKLPSRKDSAEIAAIENPGNLALDANHFHELVSFLGQNLQLQLMTQISQDDKKLNREEVEFLLSHSGPGDKKLKAWTTWHEKFYSQATNFPSVLQLTRKAASANGWTDDVESYLEILSGGQAGDFGHMNYEFSRLRELHEKLKNFVITRLKKKYGSFINKTIPAHFLGSLTGKDWTALLIDVSPNISAAIEIRKKLWEKKLMGQMLHKYATRLEKTFLGTYPTQEFWSSSNFTSHCPSEQIHFCKSRKFRLSTCNEPSLSNYLQAYRDMANILIEQLLPKSRTVLSINRQSVFIEIVSEFFSLMSASPSWLTGLGLINSTMENEEAELISLTITALDVIPRLAYYNAADQWRLNAIKKNISDPKKLGEYWWEHRLRFESIISEGGNLPTFLSDQYIANNKFYLTKFLGVLAAFQIYHHVFGSTSVLHVPFYKIYANKDLIRMVQDPSDDCQFLMKKYMHVDGVTIDNLLDYFKPLEKFLDELDTENDDFISSDREIDLENQEQEYRQRLNSPATTTSVANETLTTTTASTSLLTSTSTTTTTTTTSTTTTTTTTSTTTTTTTTEEPTTSTEAMTTTTSTESPKEVVINNEINITDSNDLEDFVEPEVTFEDQHRRHFSIILAFCAGSVFFGGLCFISSIVIYSRKRCKKLPRNRRYI